MAERPPSPTEKPAAPARRVYSAPKIVWREPYQPMSFGVSCAKQPGACNPFPVNG